jgi:signal transduction histidine kinase
MPESAQTPGQPSTYFAPPERADDDALRESVLTVSQSPVMSGLLQATGGILMVLNTHRQIMAVNDTLLRLLGCNDPSDALGLRPGEALCCVHASENLPGGCGTARACASCGAAVAIVASLDTNTINETECFLTARIDGVERSFEFRVRATPMHLADSRIVVIALQDISDQKRRESLQRVFFHDVLNTAVALKSVTATLSRLPADRLPDAVRDLDGTAGRLVQEIASQRDIETMEDGTLHSQVEETTIQEILDLAEGAVSALPPAEGKQLTVSPVDEALPFRTDPVLLVRVLTNMLKNALEATPEGGEVRLWCDCTPDRATFAVWNGQPVAESVAPRIFERYVTTNPEPGHGLGTYSMKLLGERYLKGDVTFQSSPAEGTVFSISLPRKASV